MDERRTEPMIGVTRRGFLSHSALLTATALLAACSPAPPPAPSKPAESSAGQAAKPAAPGAAPAQPAQSAPAGAAKAPEPKLGSNLVGKLEGPTVITDAAQYPKSFKEAPELGELVKQGKLPAVADRIGQDPLVIKPTREIGKYGGTLRRAFTGPGDKYNGVRTFAHDNLIYWDYSGQTLVPNIARAWELRDGGRTLIINLRRGMRWSDGQPFTPDDFVFWFKDMYQNKEIYPAPIFQMTINGKPLSIEKVDETTVAFRAPDPYPALPFTMSGQSGLAGHAYYSVLIAGPFAPAHYLKQFHPTYASKDQIAQKLSEAKLDNWVALFKLKNDWTLNPDLPVVTAWKTATPINTPAWTLERNPYSIWIDTDGNQLPYIGKVQMTLGENLEVVNLRAVAGEYDFQERHIDLSKLPVFLENRAKGNYTVHLDPAITGSDAVLAINMAYEADPEIARWLKDRDFRTAMSLGIDRGQLNESLWLGLGTPGSYVVAESSPYNPGPEYRTLNHTYDPKRANEILDKLGLDKKDSEGYRLRTDGKGRLRIELMTQGGLFFPYTKVAEMIREQWAKIGLQADAQEVERTFAEKRIQAAEHQIQIRAADATEDMFSQDTQQLFPTNPTAVNGAPFGLWFVSNGAQGKEPPPRMRELMDKYRKAFGVSDAERVQLAKEVWKIAVEELWNIGTVGLSPATQGVRIESTKLGNTPDRLLNSASHKSPGGARQEQFYFKA